MDKPGKPDLWVSIIVFIGATIIFNWLLSPTLSVNSWQTLALNFVFASSTTVLFGVLVRAKSKLARKEHHV